MDPTWQLRGGGSGPLDPLPPPPASYATETMAEQLRLDDFCIHLYSLLLTVSYCLGPLKVNSGIWHVQRHRMKSDL